MSAPAVTDLYLSPVHGGHLRDLYLHPSGPSFLAPVVYDRTASDVGADCADSSRVRVELVRSSADSTIEACSTSRSVSRTMTCTELAATPSALAWLRSVWSRSLRVGAGSVGDAATATSSLTRSTTGEMSTTDTTFRSAQLDRAVTADGATEDVASVATGFARAADGYAPSHADAARSLADARTASAFAPPAVSDAVGALVTSRSVHADLTTIEAAQRRGGTVRAGAAQTGLAEVVQRAVDAARSGAQVAAVTEAASAALAVQRSAAERTDSTERSVSRAQTLRTAAELTGLTASAAVRSLLQRTAPLQVPAEDGAARSLLMLRTALPLVGSLQEATSMRRVASRTTQQGAADPDEQAGRSVGSVRVGAALGSVAGAASRTTGVLRDAGDRVLAAASAARSTLLARSASADVGAPDGVADRLLGLARTASQVHTQDLHAACTVHARRLGAVTDLLGEFAARSTATARLAAEQVLVAGQASRRGPVRLRPVRLQVHAARAARYTLRALERLR